MSNCFEYKSSLVVHPGYYVEEIVEELGLTQQDFAKRLGTTPKNLSKLINGEQRLSVDMAMKISKMLGTGVELWLNLQKAYDMALIEIASEAEDEKDESVLNVLGENYFNEHFDFSSFPLAACDNALAKVREFLGVASLSVLRNPDVQIGYRNPDGPLEEESIIKANAMVMIAVNITAKAGAPAFSRSKFQEAVSFALTQTGNHDDFYAPLYEKFLDAGVVLVILPDLKGSGIDGAVKKVGKSIMLMVDDRCEYADAFWFTLMHEVGHIMNGDFGLSFEGDAGEVEQAADDYARDALIAPAKYETFVSQSVFTKASICSFASEIGRDPGIVVGRLQGDGLVGPDDFDLNSLRSTYTVVPFAWTAQKDW